MRSAGVKPGDGLTVIAGCFGERPERVWLAELEAHSVGISLTFVESRVALIKHARQLRPRIVLLPLRDATGVSSAPLITRLREHAPNVRVMVLLTPGASRAGLAEAIRAGGEVVVLGDAAELRSVLFRTDRTDGLSVREHEATRALLAEVPVELREALIFCVMYAHRRLSVGEIAMFQGLSARAFGRRARAARWPAASELIIWGRLLRASLLQWGESSSLAVLARESGFASTPALQRAAVRLLERPIRSPRDLVPLLVSSRLRRRVIA